MSVKDSFRVVRVDASLARDWILNKHYAKRMPPVEHCFALYNICGKMDGVVTFGTPVSDSLRNLWGGEYKVIELNRLVVNDGMPKNTLSHFVACALKMLPSPLVVVSYADTSHNHHGYIYQATNWFYTGLSAEFKDYYVKGMENLHNATVFDMSRGMQNRVAWLRLRFGDDLIMVDRPRKHRYFSFVGDKRQKKRMLKMLPYQIEPYPKGDNVRYDASYTPSSQGLLF